MENKQIIKWLLISLFCYNASMKIKKRANLKEAEVETAGAVRVFKSAILGSGEGSEEIAMRRFKILPGGNTPLHRHEWPHLVLVEKGEGVALSESDGKFKIGEGDAVFISAGEEHQFLNPFSEEIEFVCVVPSRGE